MARKKPAEKRPRRKPGTGSIRFKRGRARPYETAFPLGAGEYRYDYHATAEEATAHLDRLTAERDSSHAPRNIAKGSQTVTQFLTAWLQVRAAHISAKTLQDYQYLCELAIAEIGNYRLDQVDLLMCDTMLSLFARKGFRNVGQMRMVLRQAFEYAFDNDYIHKNPFQKAKAPRTKHRKAIALTEAERGALLEAARVEYGMPLLPLWHLESRLAFRRGETLGLMWSDIDFKSATITIQRQRTTEGNATVTKDAPKGGEQKVRTVPVFPDILELLKEHRIKQFERRLADLDWEDTGLVFVGAHGKPPAANRVNKRLAKLIVVVNEAAEKAKKENAPTVSLPTDLRPHDLRHTALFLLEQAGVAPSIRMALGGHSTASMALHYIDHASVDDVRRALGA